MYAGPSPYGVEIARDIHKRGGNAIDASVAVALSLAVTHPYYAAFGGGGFAMIKIGDKVQALDFRETAPAKSSPETFKGREPKESQDGGLAVGIPGMPAGLWDLHQKYGRLKWNQLFDGALRLADQGFRVSGEWVEITRRNRERLNKVGQRIFFRTLPKQTGVGPKSSIDLKPGELLKQRELASFLRAYKKSGSTAFYEGRVAKELMRTVNESGGVFTFDDLKGYRTRWLEPLSTEFEGHKLWLMPPPSAGGMIIASALKLMDNLRLKEKKPLSVDEFHLMAEIMKLSFRGRQLLGDPDFNKNPLSLLLDDKYLRDLATKIKMDSSVDVEPLKNFVFEHEETTHFSLMDAQGNAVAFTVTLNGSYGSGLVTPDSGIALNNEIDDFTTQPDKPNMFGLVQGVANLVRPGSRPLSSMSPTIVEKNGRTVLSIGAPGGPRITTGVLQVLYRILAQSFDIDRAIQAPRVHHQFLPDTVYLDPQKFSPEVVDGLEKRGHKIELGFTARVFGVFRDSNSILSGAGDARGESAAGGM
jgi:gamma-glutamyltranspeptidase/glutathione hydrolase